MFHRGPVPQQIRPKNPRRRKLVSPELRLSSKYLLIFRAESSQPSAPSASSASSASKSPTVRASRTPRRVGAQPTRLEAVDDSLGPLGPLGDPSFGAGSQVDDAPATPRKEQTLPSRNLRHSPPASQSSMTKSMMDSVDLGDDDAEPASVRTRAPPPVQPAASGPENIRRQAQPSVSIEQAAKPSFEITVGDPHKVGDLTSSHIVYQVRTKVEQYPNLGSAVSVLKWKP